MVHIVIVGKRKYCKQRMNTKMVSHISLRLHLQIRCLRMITQIQERKKFSGTTVNGEKYVNLLKSPQLRYFHV